MQKLKSEEPFYGHCYQCDSAQFPGAIDSSFYFAYDFKKHFHFRCHAKNLCITVTISRSRKLLEVMPSLVDEVPMMFAADVLRLFKHLFIQYHGFWGDPV